MNSNEARLAAAGNSHAAWLDWATTLRTSAHKVRTTAPAQLANGEELMLVDDAVYAMLLGYAVECALKGLWVKGGNELVKDGRFQRPRGAGDHELGQLAQLVFKAEPLPVSELSVLDRLAQFTVWAGRYPIPRFAAGLSLIDVPGKGQTSPRFLDRDDLATAERLLSRFIVTLR